MNRLLALLIAALFVAGCSPSDPPFHLDAGADSDVIIDGTDSDGDSIVDQHEGRDEGKDTDGDGVPDYQDEDSDGDGISDREEAGDENPATEPRDSDRDGVPDFQDTDSDGNGIGDADELDADTDGDGDLDRIDRDDDNDASLDVIELANGGELDGDGDGLVDFKDPDRDNDTIMDGFDGEMDFDGDGQSNWIDLDSDGDGISDADEAGDADLSTPPVDSDGDGAPDFRDLDSDNDGLSDASEVMSGTSPTNADSDNDGVSDLIEVAAGTDPNDASTSPRTEGNFVFVLPYEEAPDPERDTLEFQTSIQFADVYFLFDYSGSMSGEISAMADASATILTNLTCVDSGVACTENSQCGADQVCSLSTRTCVQDPRTTTCVPSLWSGAGRYESTLLHALDIQSNPNQTSSTIRSFGVTGGTENLYRVVEQIATNNRCAGMIGIPCFRPEAVRIMVMFTDEGSDAGTLAGASAAMVNAGITGIGVWSQGGNSERDHLVNLLRQSNSLDSRGNPLIVDGQDAAVANAVVPLINEVVEGVPLRVTIAASEVDGDSGDGVRFIDRLEVNVSGRGNCTAVANLEDTNADGFNDAFPSLTPGTDVCWDVVPVMNNIQEPSTEPLVYEVQLTVSGDGSPLDARRVFFLVPPRIPGGPFG